MTTRRFWNYRNKENCYRKMAPCQQNPGLNLIASDELGIQAVSLGVDGHVSHPPKGDALDTWILRDGEAGGTGEWGQSEGGIYVAIGKT